VRDTRKADRKYINNKPSTMNKEWEQKLKSVNFPFIHPTSMDSPSDKAV
jgi:hypothetical protein